VGTTPQGILTTDLRGCSGGRKRPWLNLWTLPFGPLLSHDQQGSDILISDCEGSLWRCGACPGLGILFSMDRLLGHVDSLIPGNIRTINFGTIGHQSGKDEGQERYLKRNDKNGV
jgi:hypothetical protein